MPSSIEEVSIQFALNAHHKFLERMSINERGCYIPTKKPRSDGYVRFSVTKGSSMSAFKKRCGERTFYVHHLAAWHATGNKMPDCRTKQHTSHLCGDTRCFRTGHLCLEVPSANSSRKNCPIATACPCPCNQAFWLCKHSPRCIAPASLRSRLETSLL
jgi:hypothetical protein